MIERVEVLTDGASATYGSEAVGGVVNIITRRSFEGVEFGAEVRDAINSAYQFNAAFGSAFERGRFATFLNYYRQDGAFRGEYDFIRARDNGGNQLDTGSRWDSGTGAGRYNRAVATGAGRWSRSGATVADPNCGKPNAIGVVNTFVAGDNCRYSFIDQRRLTPEATRLQSFTQFSYDLADTLELFAELSFSSNTIRDGIGGAVLRNTTDDGGFLVPAAHPFNYFVDDGAGNIVWDPAAIAAGKPAVDVIFRGRPLTTFDGKLADDITRKYDNARLLLGFDLDLSDAWSLNASFMQARTQFSDRQPRSYNAAAFRAAINSGAWNPFAIAWADPDAVSVKDNFSRAGNGAADLELFAANRVFQAESVQRVGEAVFSGILFELGGNPVLGAFGAQYRHFGYNDIADSLSEFRLDGRADPVFSIDDAERDVYALFGEAIVPLYEDLEIQLALRYEDYGKDGGGSTTDPKIGVRWQARDNWLLRGSFGTSFQAPSIRNTAGAVGSGALLDRAFELNPGERCRARPDSYNAAQITSGGNLAPQAATNYNLGAVFQSQSFTGSLDYWVYNYRDLIQTGDDFQDILDNECRDGVYRPDPRVIRDPSGQLNSITSAFVNVGRVETSGIDLNASWFFAGPFGGELTLAFTGTFVAQFDIDQAGDGNRFDGANNRNRFIGFGSLPDKRANLSLQWASERQMLGLTGRYIGAYRDRTPTDTANNRIASQTVWDLQYGIDLGDTTSLSVGVNNLFDADPPEVITDRIAFDGQVADPRGRTLYLRARYRFY